MYAATNFTDGAPFDANGLAQGSRWDDYYLPISQAINDVKVAQQDLSSWEVLSNEECIAAYAADFVTDRRTVIVVSNSSTSDLDGSLLGLDVNVFNTAVGAFGYDPYAW